MGQLTPNLFSLLTLLLGGLIGHWLRLGRDRRKEWNDAMQPVRLAILGAIDGEPRTFTSNTLTTAADQISNQKKRAAFIAACKKYNNAVTTIQFEGMRLVNNAANEDEMQRANIELIEATEMVLPYIKRK